MAQTVSERQTIIDVWRKDPSFLRLNLSLDRHMTKTSRPLRPKNAIQYAKSNRRGQKPSYRQRQASGRAARRKVLARR